ncbi:MAG: MFS transporter [Pseudomonadota bacterium]|nr:MFS transporter [Pseudomonadota bacterium]
MSAHLAKNNNMYITGWIIFWIASLFYFYDFLLRLAPAVMMDEIIRQYHIRANQFGLLDSIFYYTYTPLQLFAGPLIDEFGIRLILPIAMVSCILGTVIAALEISYTLLLMSRLLIGFGSAFAFIAVLKSASDWLPSSYYPFLAGLTTTLGMIGGVVAQIILPPLVTSGASLFYYTAAIICVVMLVFSLWLIEDHPNHKQAGHTITDVFKDIKDVISKPITWHTGLIGCLLFTPVQLFVTWSKAFFAQSMLIPDYTAGQISSMLFWGIALGSPIIGWLSNFMPYKRLNLIILTGAWLSMILMALILWLPQNSNASQMALLMFSLGITVATQPLVFVIIRNAFPQQLTGTASACVNMIVNISSYAQPLIGQIIQSGKHLAPTIDGFSGYSLQSWQQGLSVIVVALFISGLLAIFLKTNPPSE